MSTQEAMSNTIIFFVLLVMLSGCVKPSVIKTKYSNVNDYFHTAEKSYKQEKYEQAIYFFEVFIKEGEDHFLKEQAYYRLGEIYFLQKDYRKALLNFRKLIYKHPGSEHIPYARYHIGQSFYFLKDYQRAIQVFNKFRKDFPNSEYDQQIRLMLSRAYRETFQYEKAKDIANSILILYPDGEFKHQALYQLASSEILLNEIDSGMMHFLEALEGDLPLEYKLQIEEKVLTIFVEQHNYQEAIRLLSSLLNDDSLVNEISEEKKGELYELAAELIEQKLTIIDLKSLVVEFPSSFPGDLAMIELSDRFFRKGKIYDARIWWKRFLQTFPHHEKVEMITKKLETISSTRSMDEITIGCIAPITGEFAVYGEKIVRGIKTAIEEYNQVNEKTAKLVIVDTKGRSALARQGVTVLANEEDALAIVGPLLSETAKFAAQVAEQIRIPLITPTAGGDGICEIGNHIFRNSLTSRHQAAAIAEYAVNTLGLIDFGIFYPYNAYGQRFMVSFADIVEELGANVKIIEFYDEKDTDFRHQILRIHEVQPEVLFIPCDYEKAVLIAPQIPYYKPEPEEEEVEGDVDGKEKKKVIDNLARDSDKEDDELEENPIMLFGSEGWYDPRLIEEGEEYVNEAIIPIGFNPNSSKSSSKNFIRHFREKYHTDPDSISAQAYEATRIILYIIETGATSREDIRRGLSQLDNYHGICGTTGFSPTGESQKEVILMQVKRKRFIQIYP
ncbi:MAG: penicillin-binding protein activator [bacterium]